METDDTADFGEAVVASLDGIRCRAKSAYCTYTRMPRCVHVFRLIGIKWHLIVAQAKRGSRHKQLDFLAVGVDTPSRLII